MVANDPGLTSGATTPTVTAPPLYPTAVTPPDAPLPILAFLREFPKSPLRSVPRAAYQ